MLTYCGPMGPQILGPQLVIFAYFGILPYTPSILRGNEVLKGYSIGLVRGTEHAFSFNFIVYKELVMKVNTPVQEWKATCRIVASTGSSTR